MIQDVHPEYQNYEKDLLLYGNLQKWRYTRPDGIVVRCVARRTYTYGTWCGYVCERVANNDENLPEEITGGSERMIGFDCAHYMDFIPKTYKRGLLVNDDGHYSTFPEIKVRVEKLADACTFEVHDENNDEEETAQEQYFQKIEEDGPRDFVNYGAEDDENDSSE